MRLPSGIAVTVLVVLSCSSPAVSTTAPDGTAGPSIASVGPSLGTAAPTSTRGVTAAPADAAPPAATLAAEGGDPVAGQLGTYIWRDGGSDSPWLRGAPIAVGTGEPLSISLEPATGIASWGARSVPASADGPDGATSLGEGAGSPAFAAPGAGTWTVEVHVVFDDGLGDASYFWRLDVT
jgi:hypothetical protein